VSTVYSSLLTPTQVDDLPGYVYSSETVHIDIYSGFARFALLLHASCTFCLKQLEDFIIQENKCGLPTGAFFPVQLVYPCEFDTPGLHR